MHHHVVITQLAQPRKPRLPDSTVRVAIHLLAIVHPDTGTASLSWADYLRIANGQNRTAGRRHLTRLQAAEILHYSTNTLIYLQFRAWPMIPNRYADDTNLVSSAYQIDMLTNGQHSPDDTKLVSHDTNLVSKRHQIGANTRQSPPYPPDRLIDIDDPDTRITQINQSMAQAQTARNLALLRDEEIVMKPENAEKFAAEHTFDWLLAQVAAWWVDPTRAQYGTGGLVNRIGGKWATGHFPESFRRTDLYLRHAVLESPWSDTAAEDDDLPDLAFDPAPPLAPPLPDPDPDSEEAKVWAEVLAELALQMTAATFETWVRNTRLIQLDREDGESYAATIQVPNAYAQSWLDGRLFSTVKRTLGGILKHSVAPKFVVLDTERKETVTP